MDRGYRRSNSRSRDRGYRYDDRDRRDYRRRDSSRSRDRDRRSSDRDRRKDRDERRRRMWDDMGATAAASAGAPGAPMGGMMAGLVPPPNAAAAAMAMGGFNPAMMNPAMPNMGVYQQAPGHPSMAVSGVMGGMAINNKKQRELYVGNLPIGMTEPMMKELFAQILQQCEGFDGALGPPVLNVQLCGGGTYAFVEFRDEQCAATSMQFHGMRLSDKIIKINHPNGYVPPPVPVLRLVPPSDLLQNVGLAGPAGMPLPGVPPPMAVQAGGATGAVGGMTIAMPPAGVMAATAAAGSALLPGGLPRYDEKKMRELYVGNLTVGAVTANMLKELFLAPLQTLPENKDATVPPVIDARLDPGGKFAFLEFRDMMMASTALTLFAGMELCGRPMTVARPTGYAPPEAYGLPPAQVASGVAPLAPAPPPPPPVVPAAAQLAHPGVPDDATRLLCLENLFQPSALEDEEEYKECVEDIQEECKRFGEIESFEIPRATDLKGHSEADVGKCFVRYKSVGEAVAAYRALHGRDFDGNTVKVSFLAEGGGEKWERGVPVE